MTSDKTPTPAAQPGVPPKAPELPKNIPIVEKKDGPGGGIIPKMEEFKGEYIRSSDGETYAVAITPSDINGRTHKAMNSEHYWEGTYEKFIREFRDAGTDAPPPAEAKAKAEYEAREKAREEKEKALAGSEATPTKKK